MSKAEASGKGTYSAAAAAVYHAGRPQQQHRQDARQRKLEIPNLTYFTFVSRLKPRQEVVIRF